MVLLRPGEGAPPDTFYLSWLMRGSELRGGQARYRRVHDPLRLAIAGLLLPLTIAAAGIAMTLTLAGLARAMRGMVTVPRWRRVE